MRSMMTELDFRHVERYLSITEVPLWVRKSETRIGRDESLDQPRRGHAVYARPRACHPRAPLEITASQLCVPRIRLCAIGILEVDERTFRIGPTGRAKIVTRPDGSKAFTEAPQIPQFS